MNGFKQNVFPVFLFLGLMVVLMVNCGSTNAILKLPKEAEHKIEPVDITVKCDAAVATTLSALTIDKPLTPERVQEIISERAKINLKYTGDRKVKFEILVTDINLPALGRASGLTGNDESTMEVFLSIFDATESNLIGKYRYRAFYSAQVGSSKGFGALDTAFAVANVASAATKGDEDYIIKLVEDIINQILKQHGPE